MERPTDECFGDWIVEKRHEISDFRSHLTHDFWTATVNEARLASYDLVDLVFLNDEYCHFRKAFWDVKAYCATEQSCNASAMLENMNKNAFSIIT